MRVGSIKAIFLGLSCMLAVASGSRTVYAGSEAGTVLILGPTVSGGASSVEATAAVAAGYTVEVVDAMTWAGKSAADFATYRAIILGDATCDDISAIAAAEANKDVWGPVVNGNVILIGTDPVFHNFSGGNAVTTGAVKFAADIPGKTGAYICLSCYYGGDSSMTPVPVLSPFGAFTVTGEIGCYNDAHKVADHVALTGVTDASLSNWSCSVHEAFDSFPSNFLPLAIAENISGPGSLTFADGTFGIPYILARGDDLVPEGCGDNTVQAPEECDDGNTINGDGCSAQCKFEDGAGICGDGTHNPATEECDDGNDVDFDGCSTDCLIESECDIECHKPGALHVNAANDVLSGTSGDDTLCGDERRNEIRGGKGNDRLCGFEDDDFLQGGTGVDRVFGDSGNDTLDGGKDNSFLYGEEGNDLLLSSKGDDWLDGGPGNDMLRAEKTGNDTLIGGDGDDSLDGGKGTDVLDGGKGIDTLFGGKGNDSLIGGEGNDFLHGNKGDDAMEGGKGNDWLDGGKGNDAINGGDDTDTADGGKGTDACTNVETTVACP